MGGPSVVIRIAGFASTPHGVAFAIAEGPENMVDWGRHRTRTEDEAVTVIAGVLQRNRPLFVACEFSRNDRKSARARGFNAALREACSHHGIMILDVARVHKGQQDEPEPTNYQVALEAFELFGPVMGRPPKRRRRWEGMDERLGVFLAAACAVAGWQHFRRPMGTTRQEPISP